MLTRRRGALAAAVCALGASVSAALASQPPSPSAAPPCAGCAVITLTPGQTLLAPAQLEGTALLLRVAPGADARDWRASLDDITRRGGRGGLHLTGVPAEDDAALMGAGDALLIEVRGGDPDRLAFALKRAFARARGVNEKTTLVVAADGELLRALVARDVLSYADAMLVLRGPFDVGLDARHVIWLASGPGGFGVLDDAAAIVTGPPIAAEMRRVWRLPDDVTRASAVLHDVAALQMWLPSGLAPVPDRAVTCGSARLPTFMNPQTLDLIAVATECAANAPIVSDVPGAAIDRLDLAHVRLVRVRAGPGDRFAEGVRVVGERALSVDEIVARHQARAVNQTAAIRTLISTGSLTITFEAPGFSAPVTITAKTTMFSGDGPTDMVEEDIRVDGVSFRGTGVPRLPIIEPERVAAAPLTITLTNVYRYRLDGRDRIDGQSCYVIGFTPRDTRASLFAGRAWIATDSFALVRVSAVQTGLRGPVTSSEQTDDFRKDSSGLWLLARSDVRQTYEGAAIRTPIHRLLVIDRQEINAGDYAARRAAAHESNAVMLRDTADGYRYLEKRRDAATPAGGAAAVRTVAGRAQRVRTIAFGVLIDPNISVPLPFAGLSYVDFNLLGTGAQFNGFFGGSYGQVAFSAPSLGGTRWQLAGRAFGIATSYNDRAFEHGRERYELDIRQRPAQASVWLVRPIGARVSARFGYDLTYTHFGRADVTAADFAVPADQVVHAARLGLDVQRAGWQLSAWWAPARRAGWRAWGQPGTSPYRPGQRDFQQYGVNALRSVAVSPHLATRVEAAWMGGRDLDRFSRYAFGTFDNRLRGYPSALIRYDRGGVLRSAVAWSPGRIVRLDGFADAALVHDPAFGGGLRNFTGVGAAIEAPAPFGTLIGVEWGFGFRGVNTNGSRGTNVIRVSGYKVF